MSHEFHDMNTVAAQVERAAHTARAMAQAAIRLNDLVRIDGTAMEGRIVAIDRREGETDFLVLWAATPFRDEKTTLEWDRDIIRRNGVAWILPRPSDFKPRLTEGRS